MKEQGQKLVTAGAAILIVEPAMQLAHFGGPGVIAGLAAGAVAYLVADEVQRARHSAAGETPPPAPAVEEKPARPGQHSLAYRLVNGKSVRSEAGRVRQTQKEIVLSPDLSLGRDRSFVSQFSLSGSAGVAKRHSARCWRNRSGSTTFLCSSRIVRAICFPSLMFFRVR